MSEREGKLGIWKSMVPLHTIFHPTTETFSALWTELGGSFQEFAHHYAADLERYGHSPAEYLPKPNVPANILNISITLWQHFSAFELSIAGEAEYLLPIFTIGQFIEQAGRVTLPLAVHANHAACDGWHIAQFYALLQRELDGLALQV